MSNNFSALTPVQSGQDIRSVCSADRINAIQDLLMSLWQGENIHVGRGGSIGRGIGGVDLGFKGGKGGGGGAAAVCIPFKPTVRDVTDYAADPDADPEWKVRFALGTINGVVNTSWNDEIPISQLQYEGLLYVYINVVFSNQVVSAVTYELSLTLSAVNIDPVATAALPTNLRILAGTISKGEACMLFSDNLIVAPYVRFKEAILNPEPGSLQYKLWYAYLVRGSGATS